MRKAVNIFAWILTTIILLSTFFFAVGILPGPYEIWSVYAAYVISFGFCVWVITRENVNEVVMVSTSVLFVLLICTPWIFPAGVLFADTMDDRMTSMAFCYMPFGWFGIKSLAFMTVLPVIVVSILDSYCHESSKSEELA
ncbi:MAG: hypothetical protein JWM20_854 [Patescibacteria group bacterium]|nr:hypothetical protein [Patescibacteria group bacterium]